MRWRRTRVPQDEHLHRGYRYALALTHDEAAAEMLVHDAWFATLESGNARHLGYLLRAIRTRYFSVARREGLVVIEPDRSRGDTEVVMHLEDDLVPARASIEKALSALRSEEREVLYLAAVEGWSAVQIGELQDRPVETVAALASRAREKLRQALRHATYRSLP